MKLLFFIFTFSSVFVFGASESPERLVRRLYLDTQNRLPNINEFYSARQKILNGAYRELVNDLLSSEEFKSYLSSKIVSHYAPKRADRDQHPLIYRRLERYVKNKYSAEDTDFRQFIRDMLSADGISARNQMVLFFNGDEGAKEMAGRFSESVLGITLACAECHDHKYYPELSHKNFWSMATFFTGMEKHYVKTESELKDLKKKIYGSYRSQKALGREYNNVLEWIEMEEKGGNIYDEISYEESRGQKLSKQFEMDEMSNEKSLQAPQLFIFEKERRLTHLKLEYVVEGKKYTGRPRLLFGDNRPIHRTESPRDYLAEWMAFKKPKYFSRATTNWVARWLLGRGIVMPANDVYGDNGEHGRRLDLYADKFKEKGFRLHELVRSLLLSELYRLRSSEKSDEEGFVYFKSRKIRHLSGEQILNVLMVDKIKNYKEKENWQSLYQLEKYRENSIDQLFPNSLSDTESEFRGTLSQALFLSKDKKALELIDEKARYWFELSQEKDFNLLLNEIFITYYTRTPSERERLFFKNKINPKKSFPESGFFEMTWALINSPELRLY